VRGPQAKPRKHAESIQSNGKLHPLLSIDAGEAKEAGPADATEPLVRAASAAWAAGWPGQDAAAGMRVLPTAAEQRQRVRGRGVWGLSGRVLSGPAG
jgi:hypothetical protein